MDATTAVRPGTTAWRLDSPGVIIAVPIDSFHISPFQPAGRPSRAVVEAVAAAIAEVGSPEVLVTERGAAVMAALTPPAREFAEFVADVATHGVESPLEARRTARGLELVAGHRRLAAARLAGLVRVHVRDLGKVADHEAATIVFRRNRLRADFTPWQEAVALRQLQECRQAAGLADDGIRGLARIMGYSSGRASELLAMVRAFPPDVLVRIGGGATDVAEEGLSTLSYRAMRELIKISDPERRAASARRLAGLKPDRGAPRPAAPAAAPFFRRDVRRGGGMTLTVFKALDALSAEEAGELLALLERDTALLRRLAERG